MMIKNPHISKCNVKKKTRVVVFSTSFNKAGIAASLKIESGLDDICVNPNSPTTHQFLNDLNPAVTAYKVNNTKPGLTVALPRERPGLPLIGVDASSDKYLLFSGHTQGALSVADHLNSP